MRAPTTLGALLFYLLTLLWILPSPAASQDVPEGSAEAVAEFAEGMQLYVSQRYSQALPHLYRAHELDPNFVVSLFFAALCEGNLSSAVPRDSLYEIVLRERHRLSPYYVHRAEAQLAMINREPERALDHARQAAELGPGTKAWYNLAYNHVNSNRPAAAIEALHQMDPEREPMKGWYSYHAVLARSHHAVGDYDAERAVIQDAMEKYPDRRGTMVMLARNLGATGQMDALEDLFRKAEAEPATGAGNTAGALMIIAAAELSVHGQPEAGADLYQRAVDWYAQAGDAVSAPVHQTWRTMALAAVHDFDQALELCDRHLEAQPDYQWYHGAAGLIAARTGDEDRFAQEWAWFESKAEDRPRTFLPLWTGFFAAARGDAETAATSMGEAVEMGSTFSLWFHRNPMFEQVLDDPVYQEFIRPKG